jgi:alpha-1,2-mannosyltransferase
MIKTSIKILYYKFFASLYKFAGGFTDCIMVNSTWTGNHITSLWNMKFSSSSSSSSSASLGAYSSILRGLDLVAQKPSVNIVYPPCNTTKFQKIPFEVSANSTRCRDRLVISLGQFRPEKDHGLQVRAFHAFREKDLVKFHDIKLVMIGGCRNEKDAQLVSELKKLIDDLELSHVVEIKTNVSIKELEDFLAKAHCGLHTMWNEHFGINVVEMQAAGCIPIAHNSGGPRSDIIVPVKVSEKGSENTATGYLAATACEYADALEHAFTMSKSQWLKVAMNGRKSSSRFSDETFANSFYEAVSPLIQECQDEKGLKKSR